MQDDSGSLYPSRASQLDEEITNLKDHVLVAMHEVDSIRLDVKLLKKQNKLVDMWLDVVTQQRDWLIDSLSGVIGAGSAAFDQYENEGFIDVDSYEQWSESIIQARLTIEKVRGNTNEEEE